MPELPEVESVRKTLKKAIIGKEVEEVQVYYPMIINGDVEEFKASLKGQRIVDVRRIAKFLVFILEDHAFISHLRMEGKYRYIDNVMTNNKHDHLIFVFKDGSMLCYNDVRKFGRLQLVDKGNYLHMLPLCELGPEPWQAEIDDIYNKLQRSSLPIKALLLDQRIIAGIGNIYANEICFEMKINPKTPGNKLTKKQVKELINVSKSILEHSIKEGGTSIHSFANDGETGNFQKYLKVHTRNKCLTCGGNIIKEKVKGRGTYYCKICQK